MNDKALIQIALFAALIAALGLIPPIPFATGIPITAQSLGIMLAGLMLGPWRGGLAAALFLAVMTLGAPILAGGRGGLGVWLGPTAGFLVGYLIAPVVIGLLARAMKSLPVLLASLIAALIGGLVVVHLCGIIGFAWMTDRSFKDAALVMWVYMPGDIVKAVIAALVTQALVKALPHTVQTR